MIAHSKIDLNQKNTNGASDRGTDITNLYLLKDVLLIKKYSFWTSFFLIHHFVSDSDINPYYNPNVFRRNYSYLPPNTSFESAEDVK